MPIYEYQCPKCHSIFEEWVKISEAHGQEPCPECGALSPRLISHTSFVLKGGGWYVTDYGYRKGVKDEDSAPSHSHGSDSGASTSESSSSTASADSPAAKAEGKAPAKKGEGSKKSSSGAASGKSKGSKAKK